MRTRRCCRSASGDRTGEFVPIYTDTFLLIAVQGQDIQQVLNAQGQN